MITSLLQSHLGDNQRRIPGNFEQLTKKRFFESNKNLHQGWWKTVWLVEENKNRGIAVLTELH